MPDISDLTDITNRLIEFRFAYWRISRGVYPRAALLTGYDLWDTITTTPHPVTSPWKCDPGRVTVFGWPVWAVAGTDGEPALGPAGWQLVLLGEVPGAQLSLPGSG